MQICEPHRVGILIVKKGSWRETVAHYARVKNVIPAATSMYDDLVSKGWVEPWAALRAIDQYCCADIIVNAESFEAADLVRAN